MKQIKIAIPIIIIVIGIGIVLFDTSNETIEDVIFQQASIDNTSPVETKIGEVDSGEYLLYLYETKDGRIGIATMKVNDSTFNKYSLCEVINIESSFLIQKGELIKSYDEQKMYFTYGIVVNPQNDKYIIDDKEYQLDVFDLTDFKVGVFLTTENITL